MIFLDHTPLIAQVGLVASGVGKIAAKAICDKIHPDEPTIDMPHPSLFEDINNFLELAEDVVDSVISGLKALFPFDLEPQPRYYETIKAEIIQKHEIRPNYSNIIDELIEYINTPHKLLDPALEKQIIDIFKRKI